MQNITDTKQRILDIIRTLGRPGTDAIIDYLNRSTFFRRGCYGHHKEFGGLAQHSIEVYDHMLAHAGGFSADSIAVVALLHDLGKTRRRDGRGLRHDRRSVEILDECGYFLTADERTAIGRHHSHSPEAQACRLRRCLKTADCYSARTWNPARPC